MTLIVDSGPLVALGDRHDPQQPVVQALLEAEPGSLVVPLTVATEVDHILGVRAGRQAQAAFTADLAAGRFLVECLIGEEFAVLHRMALQYADLAPGLTDLSIVVLAARFGTARIATFDQRDFRVLRPLRDAVSFEILPGSVSSGGEGPHRRPPPRRSSSRP